MKGQEVSLDQMLERREKRVSSQNIMLEKYACPLISFSMNIPGPIKTNELIRSGFEAGKKTLLEKLETQNFIVNAVDEVHEITGDEMLISIGNAEAEKLKLVAVEIENATPLGRLFDMDVIDSDGKKLSRQNFRKCLICSRQAQECSRSRTHSVKEMQDEVEKLLNTSLL